MADRKRCCCNCGNDIRVKDKNGFVTHCECAIDGHHIGYIETFEGWCRRWKKSHTFDGRSEEDGQQREAD